MKVLSRFALVLLACAACASPKKQYPTPAQQHLANLEQINARARSRVSHRAQIIRDGGLEFGSCGFHIIDPPGEYSISRSVSPYNRSRWDWWPILPAYPGPDALPWGGQPSASHVSTRRVFPNSVATVEKVQTQNGWGLVAAFDEAGIAAVATIHGPLASSEWWTDWYGKVHVDGGSATEMQVALISDNIALLPFPATSIIGAEGSHTVVLATDLPEVQIDDLVRWFGES
ncbi:MAG: hypothetical protein ABGY41_02780 [Candidatus Poribacteria bacterium]